MTTELLWNNIISTDAQRYVCCDVENFYLKTSMDRHRNMKIPLSPFLELAIEQYDLQMHATDRLVYFVIRNGIYGLLQGRMLAKKSCPRGIL